MKIGVMTSGGDSPGMNAAVRAVVREALNNNIEIFGIENGFEGLIAGRIRPLGWHDVGGIINRGGTFLGTARSEKFKTPEGRREAVKNLVRFQIDALVVIGGDGSLTGARVLVEEWNEHIQAIQAEGIDTGTIGTLKVVGLPGSIDNDLYGTDMSIGADTALNHIIRAMDDISSTAASHQRTFVIETMGRHCGYLALMSGLAGGASWVLIPEEELDVRWHHKMIEAIDKSRKAGRPHQIVVVAEGAKHPDGLRIRSEEIKDLIARKLGLDVRLTVLGHIQRGGSPTAFDRILATRLGVAAVEFLINNPNKPICHMAGLIKNKPTFTPLDEVITKSREVEDAVEQGNYRYAQELRGEGFRKAMELVKMLTQITPAKTCTDEGSVLVFTGGADSPGMNTLVSVLGRCLLNQGIRVMAARNTFLGLIHGDIFPLSWDEIVGWINKPSSEIGAMRIELRDSDYAKMSENLERHKIIGIVAIGGLKTYLGMERFVALRERFPSFNIPVILIPASIDNNLPGTEFSVGSDTALNAIVEAVDKIRNTAGASRRTFIVEVMGRKSGFLALMGGMASGAEKAYLPERGISIKDLVEDVQMLKESFECGKKMVVFIKNEAASQYYTTDFIRRVFEEEGEGKFGVRTTILGHIQRGGAPTAFDRVVACRFGVYAASLMKEFLSNIEIHSKKALVLGLKGRSIVETPLEEAMNEMDRENERPKYQWFLELIDVADRLALPMPHCKPRSNSLSMR
ncbi:MAG: 6-phosphofructokinase [Syntrophobacterales bacterium]|nr:6-phosphofructokinase [Syntrophobacterales bacterium]